MTSQQPSNAGDSLPQAEKPADVPVFNCLVYVARGPDGRVTARVANLDGLEFGAASEREVLALVIPAFKGKVRDLVEAGKPIPWREPPAVAQPGEEPRYIPVHL